MTGCVRFALVFALVSMPTHAAVFYVGVSCEFNDVQDAIDHAAATPGADTIRIVSDHDYLHQALSINESESLDIVGGFLACEGEASSGEATLDGADPPLAPVMVINAEGIVRLRSLRITRGDSVGAGGGIRYTSTLGALELSHLIVTESNAGAYGGGVSAVGPATFDAHAEPGNGPKLRIGPDVFIVSNQAADGAGLYVSNMNLDMSMADRGGMFDNRATHDGGGMHLSNTRADIGSGRLNGMLFLNTAGNAGGGLFASRGSEVRLFSTHPDQALAISGNFAVEGGGIAVQGDELAPTRVTLFDAVIDGNSARNGSAAFLQSGGGTNVAALCMRDLAHGTSMPACAGVARPAAAMECDASKYCNRISDNVAALPTFTDFSSASVLVDGAYATLELRGTRAERNTNDVFVDRRSPIDVAGTGIGMSDCLVVDNTFWGPVMFNRGFAPTTIAGCTIAANTMPASAPVFDSDGAVILTEAIVWQGANPIHANPFDDSVRAHASMVIANETASLEFAPGEAIIDDPQFVDAANGDFHPRVGASPAIDFSNLADQSAFDLDDHARGVDDAGVADRFGLRDIGAFEASPPDVIFRDGFDAGTVR